MYIFKYYIIICYNIKIYSISQFSKTLSILEAARGEERRKTNICYGCGKSYAYPYDLVVHHLKHPECKSEVSIVEY